MNVEGRGKQAGLRLGVFGELHPLVREAWGLPDAPVLVADFDLSAMMVAGAQGILVRDIPRFPAVEEDLAVIVSEDLSAAEVAQAIQRAGGNLLSDARAVRCVSRRTDWGRQEEPGVCANLSG